ncbi:hypothetical protein IU504_24845 [Nocardia brasiliensis]|nr:hypothetical protein [Nocardia brasiliensis]
MADPLCLPHERAMGGGTDAAGNRALLEAAGADWTPISRIIAPVMAVMSVADAPLIWRVQILVESGAMVADGSPWLVRRTKVKRA